MTREEHEEDNLREVQGYEPLNGRKDLTYKQEILFLKGQLSDVQTEVENVKTYCAGIIKNSPHIDERHIAWSVINIIGGRVRQLEEWIKQLREGTETKGGRGI